MLILQDRYLISAMTKITKVEVLINNAGYGIKTPFHETPMDDEEDFIRVPWNFSYSTHKNFFSHQ
jgi:short-subunit dehydrogenase